MAIADSSGPDRIKSRYMMNKPKSILRSKIGIFAMLASMFGGYSKPKTSLVGGSSGKHRARFNLGGLPPAWKNKRQARINRGGK